MILNLTGVVATTIWDTGPHAVVLALFPAVFLLAGLILGDGPSPRFRHELRPVAVVAAPASPAQAAVIRGAQSRMTCDETGETRLEQTRRALAAALGDTRPR